MSVCPLTGIPVNVRFPGKQTPFRGSEKEPAPLVGHRTDAEGPLLARLESLGTLMAAEARYFRPETVRDMQVALDLAWGSLSPEQQAQSSKTAVAKRILDAAE